MSIKIWPAVAARIAEPTRTIEVTCFLRYSLMISTDHLPWMVRRRVADLWCKAAEEANAQRVNYERPGSVWIDHSVSFCSRETRFIPPARWQTTRRAHYRRLHLPQDPTAFLESLIERTKTGVLAVSRSAAEGILRVDDALHLTPLKPVAEDPKVTKLRAALDRRVGEAQLPKLILIVDAEVRFSWIMLGREPRSSKELLMVYAGILAQGTALSAADVSGDLNTV